jgi:hypothetical protein
MRYALVEPAGGYAPSCHNVRGCHSRTAPSQRSLAIDQTRERNMSDETTEGDGSKGLMSRDISATGVLVLLCVLAWVVAIAVGFTEFANFSDLTGSGDPSAVQISQVADEALVGVMPWFVLAVGLSFITSLVMAARRSIS